MKFDFSKSSDPDFRNKLQSDINILMSNVLYITHVVDKIGIIVNELKNSQNLQKQVDEYFEEDEKPEETHEPPLEDMAQDGNSSSS